MSKYELPKKFDYKNVSLLKQFITETGKIIPARVTGVSASNQRKLTRYIKIARFLALIPYTDMHKYYENYIIRQNTAVRRDR